MSAPVLTLEQMTTIAVDLDTRVNALAERLTAFEHRPQDTIAVPNTQFLTDEGVKAEEPDWQGAWENQSEYEANSIVKYMGKLYIALVGIPEAMQPELPPASAAGESFPGNLDKFGRAVKIVKWISPEEPIAGALSASSTLTHAGDRTPVGAVHTATPFELWRLFAFKMKAEEKLFYRFTETPEHGNTVFGFAAAGGNISFAVKPGEGLTGAEAKIGTSLLAVEHYPNAEEAIWQGPWRFTLELSAPGLEGIAGNPPPTIDPRWEEMV